MLVLDIKLLPHGDEDNEKLLYKVRIWWKSGNKLATYDYEVVQCDIDELGGHEGTCSYAYKGTLRHRRENGALELVYKVMNDIKKQKRGN